ncbi:uncharacterized protein I303_101902 [Kwoniella dejecticola CBS 10117]|uniref:Uncharacterized protein n=1 Tax=Kwoniella dejecticola CBS 10117 TaxID=1296121 RepID=A0A1A6ACG9_9TREE|nr:uncharacterized protein I303_01962 [Kwoniella dejecticola CBS 10117]OBR87750.1 hypothetical protein I303_01962 [Kwoniella dejecticola CBS 10117]
MEGYISRTLPAGPSKPGTENSRSGRKSREVDRVIAIDADSEPDEHSTPNLPHADMDAVWRRKNEQTAQFKKETANGSPYRLGTNTISDSRTRKQNINTSRRQLDHVTSQPSSVQASFGPTSNAKARVKIGSRAMNPIHIGYNDISTPNDAGPSRQSELLRSTPRSSEQRRHRVRDTLDSQSDSDHGEITYERGKARSHSPVKPASIGHLQHPRVDYPLQSHRQSSFAYELQEPPEPNPLVKGKGKMMDHRGSSPIKPRGNESDLLPDEVKDPDGVFDNDSDVQVVETETPANVVARSERRQRESPEKCQIDMLQRQMDRTDNPRKPKLRQMKDKDGNLPKAPNPPPKTRATLKDRISRPNGTIPSSDIGRRIVPQPTADISSAWLFQGQKLKAQNVLVQQQRLTLCAPIIGQGGKWWEIGFSEIDEVQTCDSDVCPFLMVVVPKISPAARKDLELMIEGEPMVDLAFGGTVNIVFQPGEAARNLIQSLTSGLDKDRLKLQHLDEHGCLALRNACETPVRDTRLRQRDDKRRRAADAAEQRKEAEAAKGRGKAPRKSTTKETDEEAPRPKPKKNKSAEDASQSKLDL